MRLPPWLVHAVLNSFGCRCCGEIEVGGASSQTCRDVLYTSWDENYVILVSGGETFENWRFFVDSIYTGVKYTPAYCSTF